MRGNGRLPSYELAELVEAHREGARLELCTHLSAVLPKHRSLPPLRLLGSRTGAPPRGAVLLECPPVLLLNQPEALFQVAERRTEHASEDRVEPMRHAGVHREKVLGEGFEWKLCLECCLG